MNTTSLSCSNYTSENTCSNHLTRCQWFCEKDGDCSCVAKPNDDTENEKVLIGVVSVIAFVVVVALIVLGYTRITDCHINYFAKEKKNNKNTTNSSSRKIVVDAEGHPRFCSCCHDCCHKFDEYCCCCFSTSIKSEMRSGYHLQRTEDKKKKNKSNNNNRTPTSSLANESTAVGIPVFDGSDNTILNPFLHSENSQRVYIAHEML